MSKWKKRIFLCVIILGILFISVWNSIVSVDEFRTLVKTRPLYCATLTDRKGMSLGPIYTLPAQSEYVPLDSVPAYVRNDLVFFEDKSFYDWYQFGINYKGLIRAIINFDWLIMRPGAGGGSSIHQQLYRIVTQHKEHSVGRKFTELFGALKLWMGLTKDEVLEAYINNVYFGAGPRLGIAAAADRFFSKKVSQLTRAEGIMLVSFLNRPPSGSLSGLEAIYGKYRKRVERLKQAGLVSSDDPDYEEILIGPEFNLRTTQGTSFGVFTDRVIEEANLILKGTDWSLNSDGLCIETTLDVKINDSVLKVVLSNLYRYYGSRSSFIMLDRENEVIAYIPGGASFRGGFDDLQSDQVMPASRFKLLPYALAVEKLLSKGLNQKDVLNYGLPTYYQVTEKFAVHDSGPIIVPLRKAISESKNACAYYVSNVITTQEEIVNFASLFGKRDLQCYPSIGLGTQGFSEFRLCWIYSTILVRNGFVKRPTFVKRILTKSGIVLYDAKETQGRQREKQILSIKTCKILRQALRESVDQGTSSYLNQVTELKAHDVAVKTGTSQRYVHLGLTGSVDDYTFSLLLQGKNFHSNASQIAVPIAASILSKIVPMLE